MLQGMEKSGFLLANYFSCPRQIPYLIKQVIHMQPLKSGYLPAWITLFLKDTLLIKQYC